MILGCYTVFACATRRRRSTACHVKYLHVPLRTEMRSKGVQSAECDRAPRYVEIAAGLSIVFYRNFAVLRKYSDTKALTYKRNPIFAERFGVKIPRGNSIRPSIAGEIEPFPITIIRLKRNFPIRREETMRSKARSRSRVSRSSRLIRVCETCNRIYIRR